MTRTPASYIADVRQEIRDLDRKLNIARVALSEARRIAEEQVGETSVQDERWEMFAEIADVAHHALELVDADESA